MVMVAIIVHIKDILSIPATRSFDGSQFSFDKHHGVSLKLYRQPLFLNTITVGLLPLLSNFSIFFSILPPSGS